jgi:hypothetical protein
VITNREDSSSSQEAPFSLSMDEKSGDNEKRKTSPSATNLHMAVSHRTSICINRTQAILEKASTRGFISSTSADLLSTARRLGINVMSVRLLERYVDKFMKKSKSLNKQNEEDGCENGSEKSVNETSIDERDRMPTGSMQQQQRNNGSSLKITNQKSKVFLFLSQESQNYCFLYFLLLLLFKTLSAVYKLKAPFLKFESVCKQYKPIYQEFNVWHEISYDSTRSLRHTHSPFQTYFSDGFGFKI